MKSITGNLLGCLVLFALLAISSCKKEKTLLTEKSTVLSGMRVISECYSGIDVVCNDVLRFATVAEYESTIDCIEESYDTWNDNFETQNTYTNDVQWNNLIDSLNFDEEQPYKAFSSYLQFFSYYNYIDSLEKVWVDVYNCDSIHDPDLIDIVGDDAEASVLNRNLEVMVGDTIYKFYGDGVIIKIYGADCDALNAIRQDSANVSRYSNATRYLDELSANIVTCGRLDQDGWKVYWNGADFIRVYNKINFFFGTKNKAKTKSYKQKNNGKYKKWAVNQQILLLGYEMDNNCGEIDDYNKSKQKRRKKIKIKFSGASKYWYIPNGYNFSTHIATANGNSVEDSVLLIW